MNFVYVLSCSNSDYYYEQFLLSVTSLRFFNPNANIFLLIDEKTNHILNDRKQIYEPIISKTEIISTPVEYSQKEASRWIKTSIHHYVSGSYLFIDCDTVITQELIPDFSQDVHIGAVLDTHVTLDRHHLKENFQKEDKKAGFSSSLNSNVRFNGGLIYYSGDTKAQEYFEKWHSLWIEGRNKGCSQDMPSLNQANFDMGNIITELDGTWNCQISHNGLPYLNEAKIIHYYATSLVSFTPAYIPASIDTLKSIKNTGSISPNVLKLLENPKSAFSKESRIIADDASLDIIDSAYFSKLLWLKRKHSKTFYFLNNIISNVKNPINKRPN